MILKFSFFPSHWRLETYKRTVAMQKKLLIMFSSATDGILKLSQTSPLSLNLIYILCVSVAGFLLLRALPMKEPLLNPQPEQLDLFFMSVSASTVSSMSAVETESFSNSQLTLLIFLMLFGSEVFTSLLFLLLSNLKLQQYPPPPRPPIDDQEPELELGRSEFDTTIATTAALSSNEEKIRSFKYLAYAITVYMLLAQLAGYIAIKAYLASFEEARNVLKGKGINENIFAVFTVISSFSNCGFLPTNESMIPFKTNSGLLLTVGSLILLGNTMYPIGLRFMILAIGRIGRRQELSELVLKHGQGHYGHLISGQRERWMLAATVSAFVMLQTVLFLCLEWNSAQGIWDGMNGYEKVVGSWFMSVNSRHAGESIVDLSVLSSAILALIVVMMYLPPYTTFMPMSWRGKLGEEDSNRGERDSNKGTVVIFSQLSYLAIFTIMICITERRSISQDPLNFKVLNIILEVASAYGNVGYTTGYSCKRRLKIDRGSSELENCRDSWVGFSGRWTNRGKVILLVVMIFGRLKRYCSTTTTKEDHQSTSSWILR